MSRRLPNTSDRLCTACGLVRRLDEFHKGKSGGDCKTCVCSKARARRKYPEHEKRKAAIRAHQATHRAKARVIYERWYAVHRDERLLLRRQRRALIGEPQREKDRARAKAWYEANKGVANASGRRRQAIKLSAFPAWADAKEIASFYAEAARLSAKTGLKWVVDHSVPLISPRVCGLHWEGNLNIVTQIANARKGNRYWPEDIGLTEHDKRTLYMLEAYGRKPTTAEDYAN